MNSFIMLTSQYNSQDNNLTTNSEGNPLEFLVSSSTASYQYTFTIDSHLYLMEDSYFIQKLKSLISSEYSPTFIAYARLDKDKTTITIDLPEEHHLKSLKKFIENQGFQVVNFTKPILLND